MPSLQEKAHIPSGQDSSILLARVANHSARFGSPCRSQSYNKVSYIVSVFCAFFVFSSRVSSSIQVLKRTFCVPACICSMCLVLSYIQDKSTRFICGLEFLRIMYSFHSFTNLLFAHAHHISNGIDRMTSSSQAMRNENRQWPQCVIIKSTCFIYTLLLNKSGNQWPSLTTVIKKRQKYGMTTYNR